MTEELINEVDEIKDFAECDYINEDDVNYLLSDIEDENYVAADSYLKSIETPVREVLEHIVKARKLINSFLENN